MYSRFIGKDQTQKQCLVMMLEVFEFSTCAPYLITEVLNLKVTL